MFFHLLTATDATTQKKTPKTNQILQDHQWTKDIGYYKINNEYFTNIKMLNNLLIIGQQIVGWPASYVNQIKKNMYLTLWNVRGSHC